MQVDIKVESELKCVLLAVAGANQLVESPAPYRIDLGRLECLELSRSHPFPLARSAVTITLWSRLPSGKSLIRVKAQWPRTSAPPRSERQVRFLVNPLARGSL